MPDPDCCRLRLPDTLLSLDFGCELLERSAVSDGRWAMPEMGAGLSARLRLRLRLRDLELGALSPPVDLDESRSLMWRDEVALVLPTSDSG